MPFDFGENHFAKVCINNPKAGTTETKKEFVIKSRHCLRCTRKPRYFCQADKNWQFEQEMGSYKIVSLCFDRNTISSSEPNSARKFPTCTQQPTSSCHRSTSSSSSLAGARARSSRRTKPAIATLRARPPTRSPCMSRLIRRSSHTRSRRHTSNRSC